MTLTLPKLLLLAAIVWLVWMFLRKSQIIGRARKTTEVPPKGRGAERAVEDMVKCPKCGAYVPEKGGHNCQGA
jgi:hypothetical protein